MKARPDKVSETVSPSVSFNLKSSAATRRSLNMVKAQHILRLSPEERRNFLDSFDLVLFDCDGVLWHLAAPLDGAKSGLEAITSCPNKKIGYVSNNSYISRGKYEENFRQLGITFDYSKDLLHPAEAIVNYLRKINFDGIVYLIASDPFKQVFQGSEFQWFSMPSTTEVSSLREIMTQIAECPKATAVVYDVDLNLNLTKFYAAQYFLRASPDCLLIFGAHDKTFHYQGLKYAGVGTFMEALANQASQTPILLGKPGAQLGEMVLEKFHISDRKRVLFVGDTLSSDIEFANKNDFQSLLVLSGETSKEMFENISNDNQQPKYYADSVFDFVDLVNRKQE